MFQSRKSRFPFWCGSFFFSFFFLSICEQSRKWKNFFPATPERKKSRNGTLLLYRLLKKDLYTPLTRFFSLVLFMLKNLTRFENSIDHHFSFFPARNRSLTKSLVVLHLVTPSKFFTTYDRGSSIPFDFVHSNATYMQHSAFKCNMVHRNEHPQIIWRNLEESTVIRCDSRVIKTILKISQKVQTTKLCTIGYSLTSGHEKEGFWYNMYRSGTHRNTIQF